MNVKVFQNGTNPLSFRVLLPDGKWTTLANLKSFAVAYIQGMREEDGPQKLREYVVAVFARGYCMGSLDTMRDSQSKNSKP